MSAEVLFDFTQVFSTSIIPIIVCSSLAEGPGNAPEPFVRLQRPFTCTCLCFGRPKRGTQRVKVVKGCENNSAIEIATNPLRDHTSNKGGEFNRIHVPRGNVQPKRHGEMLDPSGRHLVSMTSGKTDHLTCQDAHLQCMEAQWQRAKWEVIYRSQNHRNQIGRKQGGLYQYNIYIYLFIHELVMNYNIHDCSASIHIHSMGVFVSTGCMPAYMHV